MKTIAGSIVKIGVVLSVAAVLLCAGSPLAAAPYYQGKTIRLIVPLSPGGTYDTLARIVALHIPRHIPGNPKVIVVNRPGGGGLIGERFLYTSGKAGLYIGHFPSGHIVKQLTGAAKNIDFTRFEWLGSAGGSCYMMFMNSKIAYRSIEDLRSIPEPIKLGALTRGTTIGDTALILKKMLGLNIKVVFGYKGYNDIALAVRQGELDGVTTAVVLLKVHALTNEMINSNFCRVVLLMKGVEPGKEYEKYVKGLPYAVEFIKDPADRRVYRTYMNHFAISRPFMAPPGTNPQALDILRNAYWETMNDKMFVEAAEKRGFVLNPAKYDQVTTYVKELLKMPESHKQRLLEVLEVAGKG